MKCVMDLNVYSVGFQSTKLAIQGTQKKNHVELYACPCSSWSLKEKYDETAFNQEHPCGTSAPRKIHWKD